MSDILTRLDAARTKELCHCPDGPHIVDSNEPDQLAQDAKAEIERLRRCLAKQPNTILLCYEDGDHQRLARAACKAIDEAEALREENEALRTALVVWRNAYKTGRNEPLVMAHEHAEALLAPRVPEENESQ